MERGIIIQNITGNVCLVRVCGSSTSDDKQKHCGMCSCGKTGRTGQTLVAEISGDVSAGTHVEFERSGDMTLLASLLLFIVPLIIIISISIVLSSVMKISEPVSFLASLIVCSAYMLLVWFYWRSRRNKPSAKGCSINQKGEL